MTDSLHKSCVDGYVLERLTKSKPYKEIVRKLFLYDFSTVLLEHSSEGFEIVNAIADHFSLPFASIKIVGSGQLGYSYIKSRDFIPGESDLDIAIIDDSLYRKYCEIVYRVTNRYSDLTKFPVKGEIDIVQSFKDYLCRGIFRPDYMPYCSEKESWFKFFNRLGGKYSSLFKNINGGIYFSEYFFEGKQESLIYEVRKASR